MNGPGNLIIRPICGKLTRDTDFFTKMDPYCVITVGTQKQKTRVASGAGKFPSWQDALVFRRTTEDIINISVFDYDSNSRDDFIGEASVAFYKICSTPNWEEWITINYKGRSSGEVRISGSFAPDTKDKGFGRAQTVPGYAPQAMPPGYPPQGMVPGYPQPVPVMYPPQGMVPAYPPQMPPAYPAYPPGVMQPAYPSYPPSIPGYVPQAYPYPPTYPGHYPQYPYYQ